CSGATSPRSSARLSPDDEIVELGSSIAVDANANLSAIERPVSNRREALAVDCSADDRPVEVERQAMPRVQTERGHGPACERRRASAPALADDRPRAGVVHVEVVAVELRCPTVLAPDAADQLHGSVAVEADVDLDPVVAPAPVAEDRERSRVRA